MGEITSFTYGIFNGLFMDKKQDKENVKRVILEFISVSLLLWALVVLLSSCSNLSTHNSETFYKRDMLLEINDKEYEGTAVVEDISDLDIKAFFKDDGDLLRIKTCHRSLDYEKVWKTKAGIFVKKDSARIELKLNTPIENQDYCPIEITAFSHSGKHSWAFMDKKTPNETLSAMYRCNGESGVKDGVGICQSYVGLEQRIEFQVPVNIRTSCPYFRIDEMAFMFKPKKGYCTYSFKSEVGTYHRMTAIGYEAIKLKQ